MLCISHTAPLTAVCQHICSTALSAGLHAWFVWSFFYWQWLCMLLLCKVGLPQMSYILQRPWWIGMSEAWCLTGSELPMLTGVQHVFVGCNSLLPILKDSPHLRGPATFFNIVGKCCGSVVKAPANTQARFYTARSTKCAVSLKKMLRISLSLLLTNYMHSRRNQLHSPRNRQSHWLISWLRNHPQ